MSNEQEDAVVMTPEQWVAARMLVTLLAAEANGNDGDTFDFDTIGMELMPVEGITFALTAEHQILLDDVLFAAKLLLWSLINQFAEDNHIDPATAVSHLAIRLALSEP